MDKPIAVGITGGSGSGKTRFMKQLMSVLPEATLFSMDNYYKEISRQPRDESGVANFDQLESIDIPKYASDLQKLIAGESITIKEYTYNKDRGNSRYITLRSNPILLVEGIFVLHDQRVREQLDLKLFVEAPDYLMMSRRITRDARERGYDLSDVLYRYQHHVHPAFESFIGPSRKWADLIIPNHTGFEKALQVIGAFLIR